ncbi:MAG: penicillin-binding protein 2 [Nitrospinae bacterium]|nr:penicillin-binding protein 2 [Nitrospinota bacterium]
MRLSGQEQNFSEVIKRRMLVFTALIIAFFLFLIFRLWYLQVIKSDELKLMAENNRVRTVPLKAYRGKIFDRNKREIIDSRPSFNLSLTPEDVKDIERVLSAIGSKIKIDTERIKREIKNSAPFQPVIIKRDISWDEVAFIEERLLDLPGIFLDIEPVRNYLHGETGSHIFGYLGEITKTQLDGLKISDYRLGDFIGQYGIEKKYETILKGKRGSKLMEVDAAGRELKILRQTDPDFGYNLYLTIDIELQKEAERLFEGKNGALVAMDPRDGSILAMVSKPSFDPNLFAGGVSKPYWSNLITDDHKPLQNRAIHGQYPPGSVFKIITAAAGLEEEVITPSGTIDCPGYFKLGKKSYRCWKKGGHGRMDVHNALIQSCDVFFYTVGFRLGVDRLSRYSKGFGLGNPTNIDLEGEKGGLVPTSDWKESVKGEPWILGETVSVSIGQGFNLVTPIQLANMIASVANGGKIFKPRIVWKMETTDGNPIEDIKPEIRGKLAITQKNLDIIREALYGVVNDPRGTGRASNTGAVKVAGKTGTAQVIKMPEMEEKKDEDVPYEFRDHAWFVAFAPYENPTIAVSVLVEHGGHGGSVAAPIAGKLIKSYIEGHQSTGAPEHQ